MSRHQSSARAHGLSLLRCPTALGGVTRSSEAPRSCQTQTGVPLPSSPAVPGSRTPWGAHLPHPTADACLIYARLPCPACPRAGHGAAPHQARQEQLVAP